MKEKEISGIKLLGEVKRAKLADVNCIFELMRKPVREGKVLFRPKSELVRRIKDFFVYQSGEKAVGCAALRIWTRDAGEIQSLVVSPEHIGKGVATKLIEQCLKEAKNLGLFSVFMLTYEAELARKMGFKKTNRLPEIVRTERFIRLDKIYRLDL